MWDDSCSLLVGFLLPFLLRHKTTFARICRLWLCNLLSDLTRLCTGVSIGHAVLLLVVDGVQKRTYKKRRRILCCQVLLRRRKTLISKCEVLLGPRLLLLCCLAQCYARAQDDYNGKEEAGAEAGVEASRTILFCSNPKEK